MRLPKKILWPTNAKELCGWRDYIHHGFEALGIPIESSVRLQRDADERVWPVEGVRGVTSFELVYEEKVQRIWYDIGCFSRHHGYEKLMNEHDLYFKIRMDARHIKYPRMFPIANRVTRPERFFPIMPQLRKASRNEKYVYDILAILRMTEYVIRSEAIRLVLKHGWKTEAWLTPHKRRPAPTVPLRGFKFDYEDCLMKQAHTKIGLALPGIGDMTFRQMEIMAMGRPCLITTPTTITIAEGKDCWIECKRDMSDFVEIVTYYLEHEEEREVIGRNGQAYWEKYYSPKGQAEYVLKIAEENP